MTNHCLFAVRGGVEVKSVFVGTSKGNTQPDPHSNDYVTCSRGVKIVPDLRLPDIEGGAALEYDALIVPGGMEGAKTIAGNEDVAKLLAAAYGKGKLVACICAGSLAAKSAGITDKPITSHPSVKDELKEFNYREEYVLTDKRANTEIEADPALGLAAASLSQTASSPVADQARLSNL